MKRRPISCLNQVDTLSSENEPHNSNVTSNLKTMESEHIEMKVQNYPKGVVKNDDNEHKDHENTKISGFHKTWFKFRRYLSKGNSAGIQGMHGVDIDSSMIENDICIDHVNVDKIDCENHDCKRIDKTTNRDANKNELTCFPVEPKGSKQNELDDNNNIVFTRSKNSSKRYSNENVERWLKYYHKDYNEKNEYDNAGTESLEKMSNKFKMLNTPDQFSIKHSRNDSEQMCPNISPEHCTSKVSAHQRKCHVQNQAIQQPNVNNYHVIDLNTYRLSNGSKRYDIEQNNDNQIDYTLYGNKNENLNGDATSSYNKLNPSLLQFVTELVDGLEKMQTNDSTIHPLTTFDSMPNSNHGSAKRNYINFKNNDINKKSGNITKCNQFSKRSFKNEICKSNISRDINLGKTNKFGAHAAKSRITTSCSQDFGDEDDIFNDNIVHRHKRKQSRYSTSTPDQKYMFDQNFYVAKKTDSKEKNDDDVFDDFISSESWNKKKIFDQILTSDRKKISHTDKNYHRMKNNSNNCHNQYDDNTVKVEIFDVAPSIAACLNKNGLKLIIDKDREVVYDFNKNMDPSELLHELRVIQQKAKTSHSNVFGILEHIINLQSKVIQKLQSDLKNVESENKLV